MSNPFLYSDIYDIPDNFCLEDAFDRIIRTVYKEVDHAEAACLSDAAAHACVGILIERGIIKEETP